MSLSGTVLLHADDSPAQPEVAPSISVTTTFRTPETAYLTAEDYDPSDPKYHIYSRYTQDVSGRVEKVLGKIMNGWAVTYASGLASIYSALVHFRPKRIAIGEGYHGTHMTISVYEKSRGIIPRIDLDSDYQEGDLVWIETPLNPTGEVRNIRYYAEKAHAVGAKVVVDATFAPPPLQDPFKWGADMVMHSGTKYLGGHSDALCGVLVAKTREEFTELHHNRTYMGNMMGSLEAWLLLRSLRTLHLRVERQSKTATALATWLRSISLTPTGQSFDGVPGGIIETVWHSSFQEEAWVKEQMSGGYNATFAIMLSSEDHAYKFPSALEYFTVATSLGGVESLVEQRRRADPHADPRLIRLSIGVEELQDLKDDIKQALLKLSTPTTKHVGNGDLAA